MNKEKLSDALDDLLDIVFWSVFTGIVIALVSYAASADPLIGQDIYAIQSKNFNFKNFSDAGAPTGNLHWTFGESLEPVKQFISQVKPKFHRVHLLNTTCVRNRNCGPYEPVAGYTIQSLDSAILQHNPKLLGWVKAQTLLYKTLSEQFPETRFLISPALEHNLSKQAWRVLADTVLEVWPRVQLVNSGMNPGQERYKGAWLENHGNFASTNSDIVSLDGVEATDIAIVPFLKRFNHVKIIYIWSRGYNCRNLGPWQDPRARTSCSDGATLELLAHIADPRGIPPKLNLNCNLTKFSSPDIWKLLAEDKGVGDKRANRPVAIFSGSSTRVDVIDATGKVLGYLGYYGAYQGAQKRYYSGQIGSGDSGYQFTSGYAWLKQGNKCWGPLVTGRRQGSFR